MHKITSISLKTVEVVILSENSFILSVAQFVRTVVLFSAGDKSRAKWDNPEIQYRK